MLVKIFFSGSHSSPDMALGFIQIEHHTGFSSQRRINYLKPFGHIFMFGRYNSERCYLYDLLS